MTDQIAVLALLLGFDKLVFMLPRLLNELRDNVVIDLDLIDSQRNVDPKVSFIIAAKDESYIITDVATSIPRCCFSH